MNHNWNDSDRKIKKEDYEFMEEFPEDFDIDEIVHEAWSELYSMDDSDIWEDD